jgi:hypothetical protein
MIGHYLLTLDVEQENRVLTNAMRPGAYFADEYSGPCLVGVVCGGMHTHLNAWMPQLSGDILPPTVENKYDDLCRRFTTERINAAIRNRILANQARRTLQCQQLETA